MKAGGEWEERLQRVRQSCLMVLIHHACWTGSFNDSQ